MKIESIDALLIEYINKEILKDSGICNAISYIGTGDDNTYTVRFRWIKNDNGSNVDDCIIIGILELFCFLNNKITILCEVIKAHNLILRINEEG